MRSSQNYSSEHPARCSVTLAAAVLIAALSISLSALASSAALGLPALSGAPPTSAAASLGRRLFFDKRLSVDGTISCASCHEQSKAFSDGIPVASGVRHQLGTRNTPSLWNVAFSTSLFWDGRRTSLEAQSIDPLLNAREHGLRDANALLDAIRRDDEYAREFVRVYGVARDAITVNLVTKSLASFERTLLAGDSRFDRYLYGRDHHALSIAEARGLELFRGRGGCSTCHTIGEQSALLTDNLYHRVGVGMEGMQDRLGTAARRVVNATPTQLDLLISSDPDVSALGRFVVTKRPNDIGLFRTPSLRNVALTAPYMHDGSVTTLAEALDVEIYYRSLESARPLILTPREKADLLAFLDSLTSPSARNYR